MNCNNDFAHRQKHDADVKINDRSVYSKQQRRNRVADAPERNNVNRTVPMRNCGEQGRKERHNQCVDRDKQPEHLYAGISEKESRLHRQ